MEVILTGDVSAESGLTPVILGWSGKLEDHFVTQDFGAGVSGVTIVLMCRSSKYGFQKRSRFSKRDRIVYTDVMLELDHIKRLGDRAKKEAVAQKVVADVAATLDECSISDFDNKRFINELNDWLGRQL